MPWLLRWLLVQDCWMNFPAHQEPTALEDGVRMAREAMTEVAKQAGLLVDQVNHIVETGKAHTQGKLDDNVQRERL